MTFPGTSDHIWGCYYGIKKIQNKIIMAPYNTEDIYIYDLDKRQGIKLVLSEAKDNMKLFDEIIEYKGESISVTWTLSGACAGRYGNPGSL